MLNYTKLDFEIADAYIVTSEHNRRYFTGFHSSYGVLFVCKNQVVYFTDSRYSEACGKHFAGSNVEVRICKFIKALEEVISIAANNGVKSIGFEDNMAVSELNTIKSIVTNMEYIACGAYFELKRSVKTAEELFAIKTSMEISARSFDQLLPLIKVGMTEREINANLVYLMLKNGADSLAFDTILASGTNSSKPHAGVSNRVINKGEFVTIDFGAKANGYCADITRTIAIGKVSDEMKYVYDVVLKANLKALKGVKEGATCHEIDSLARELIAVEGFGENFNHGLGHGVGVEIHEAPTVSKGMDTVLLENMVITIEPGIYIENQFGVRIEDTIAVTKNGYTNFTPITKELIVIK